jgi:flagellar protein FliS
MVAPGYARTYQRQAVVTASPGQLVLMLYDGALRFLHRAQDAFALPPENRRRIEAIHQNLMRAQAILHELNRTLDKEAGGEFARTMARLYDYHRRRLIEANMKKQRAPLDETEKFFTEIRAAWAEMLSKGESTPAAKSA